MCGALPIVGQVSAGVTRPGFDQSEDMAVPFGGFIGAIVAGVALIFAVLVLLFRSFFKPATVLAALPLSLNGAFVALKLGRAQVNLLALIGLLMLMGLSTSERQVSA
jgi:HAE1 family hydrophobic/amphiphilic exporter-1